MTADEQGGKSVVQRGLWFEEFEIGTTYLHRPGRTVTEADNVLFTTLTMNTQSLHLDAAWAAEQPGFRGERLVNSMFTLSTLVGLSVAQLTLGTIVANLGFSEVSFPKPVFHGDTLYAETVCTGKRESKSRPGRRHRHPRAHRAQPARRRRCAGGAHHAGTEAGLLLSRHSGGAMNLRAAGPGWLFCPADRPERFAKAAAAADVVILDLEDGVAEAEKPAARKALRETPLDPERTVVRINAAGTDEQARDLDALADTAYTTVMLSKTESAAQVTALAPRDVVALVETPRGAVFAAEIAAAEGTVAMMWGAEDLVATLGGSSSRRADGTYRDVARHVRSTILLAASAFGRIALDAVHLDIRDIEGLQAEATTPSRWAST